MKASFFRYVLLLILVSSSCHLFQQKTDPVVQGQDSSATRKSVEKALEEAKTTPGPTTSMSADEQRKFEALRSAAFLCNDELANVTEKQNQCAKDYQILLGKSMRFEAEGKVCQDKVAELTKLHRWDWLTDWVSNLGSTLRGMGYGSILTLLALALLWIGIKIGKVQLPFLK